MTKNHLYVSAILVTILFCPARGGCPSADLTGDCFVDFEDFAMLASQWLTTDPCIPDDFVYIPDGEFLMGDSFNEGDEDEKPLHTVKLDSFAMGKFEVTNEQYCQFLNSALESESIIVSDGMVAGNGTWKYYCDTSTSDPASLIGYSGEFFSVRVKNGRSMSQDPMVLVSWFGAAAYCNWLSQQDGYEICYNTSDPNWSCDFSKKGYRLTTEAEWEYAARGGLSGKRFCWGDTISQTQANYYSDYRYSYDVSPDKNIHHPLWNDGINPLSSPMGFFNGTMKHKTDYQWPGSATSYQTASGANNYGLYDMAGNVLEWCNDSYGAYSSGLKTNPTGPESGYYCVLRGGGWDHNAYGCRVADRHYRPPDTRTSGIGFRCVLNIN